MTTKEKKYVKHWMTWTRIYEIWRSMKKRCNNKNNKDYGWRWIVYDSMWQTFDIFINEMWDSYKDDLFLDRINNDGNYSKDNCRWVTRKQNARNTRANVLYKGKCLAEWCEELWLNVKTVYSRVNLYKRPIKKALEFN